MPFNLLVVLILLGGWLFSRGFSRIGLPAVLGMVVWGSCMGLLRWGTDNALLAQLEPFLKSFALIVILLRAGLGISRVTLRKAGKTAVLMAFVPCLVEGTALTVVFHLLFGFGWATAGLTGFMLSAVSPAVIVPSMLTLKNDGFGKHNEVPTIILAGASADDVLAITLFTVFLQSAAGGAVVPVKLLLSIPVSLVAGIVPGAVIGLALVAFFRKRYSAIRATEKALIVLMVCVVLVQIGEWMHSAALLGVMTIGFVLLEKEEKVAHELAVKLSKVWIIAELVLFVLIGMAVDVKIAWSAGARGLAAIAIGLVFRSAGVWLATAWSALSLKERLFCVIAYIPKATVQAALGGVALANGIPEGNTILAIAVLSIVFTAPLGLIGIRLAGKKLLAADYS